MPSYKTDRLEHYEPRFVEVAEDLFNRVSQQLPEGRAERHLGSYSFYGHTIKDTAVKIVIYDPQVGRGSHMPRMRDGVYIWVRANGLTGDRIWGNTGPTGMRMFQRMWRDETLEVSANPQAQFAYFPLMAGDDVGELATFIVACANL